MINKVIFKLETYLIKIFGKRVDPDFLFLEFIKLTQYKRIILNVSTNKKLLVQIESIRQAQCWDAYFDMNKYNKNDYFIYFVENTDEYHEKRRADLILTDFFSVKEKMEERERIIHFSIFSVNTSKEMRSFIDMTLETLYDFRIVQQPKNISLFEVYQ